MSSSLRATPAAWRLAGIGLGLLCAAVNTGNNLIYLSFSLLIAGGLVSAALALSQMRRLGAELRLPAAPTAGAPFVCEVKLENASGRLTARAVEVALVADHDLADAVLVERIAAGASIGLVLPARGAPRGLLCVRGIALRSRYPLALLERRVFLEQPQEVLVLPRCDAPGADRLVADVAAEGDGAATRQLAGSEILGLRRGQDEDDARAIDWKVTARRGVLIVRETAGDGRIELALRLSTRSGGEPAAARASFEDHLSRIAGRARSVLHRGGMVRLTIDGARPESYATAAELPRMLRRLAGLEPKNEQGAVLPPLPPPASTDPAEVTGRGLRRAALAAVAIGSIALFAFGAIGAPAAALLAFGLVATAFYPRAIAARDSLAGRQWRLAAILVLPLFLVDLLALRHDLLASSSSLLVFVTLMALFNARSEADDLRLLLISFIQIVLAAALTTELLFALPLLLWLYTSVRGLMASCGAREAAAAGRVALATAAVGAAVFSLVPHLGTGTFRPTTLRRQAVSGFSEATTLGDIGRIKLDGTKVMEVSIESRPFAEGDLRWRGLALTRFDGRTWTRSPAPPRRVAADANGRLRPTGGDLPAVPFAGRSLVHEIQLEPLDSAVVFSAARPRQVRSRDLRRLSEDREGNLELPAGPRRRLTYTVTSDLEPPDPERLRRATGEDPPEIAARHLSLPRLDPRIPALAREITAGASNRYDAAVALERWLSSRLEYSLAVSDANVPDPLARFLFEGAPGHCEYFATAMVVLARAAEIPSRFVAGYLRGERSHFGQRYLVRQSDAHSWVEVFFPGVGWTAFDPTPPAGQSVAETGGLGSLASFVYSALTRSWDDYVVGVDLDDQLRALLSLASVPWSVWLAAFGAALLLITLVPAWRMLRAWKPREQQAADAIVPLPAFYRQLLELLDGRGFCRRPDETPRELAERAGVFLGSRGGDRLRELTGLYYRVRFDRATPERSVRRIAHALLDDVREELSGGASA